MKKIRNIVIIILLIVCYFFYDTSWHGLDKVKSNIKNNQVVTNLSDFLTDTNTNWKAKTPSIWNPKSFLIGGFVKKWQIPPACQDYVGYKIKLKVSSSQSNGVKMFYKGTSNNGYLVIIINAKNPLIIVTKTKLSGVNAFLDAMTNEQEIDLEIISATNIDGYEWNIISQYEVDLSNKQLELSQKQDGFMIVNIDNDKKEILFSEKNETSNYQALLENYKDFFNRYELDSSIFD